jgi:hypothetical protein
MTRTLRTRIFTDFFKNIKLHTISVPLGWCVFKKTLKKLCALGALCVSAVKKYLVGNGRGYVRVGWAGKLIPPRPYKKLGVLCVSAVNIVACNPIPVAPSLTPAPTQAATHTLPAATNTPIPADTLVAPTLTPPPGTATPDLRLPPEQWQQWPVIPTFSPRALEIYRQGLAKGTNPKAFSKVGDCESGTDWFLMDFDRGAQYYRLGEYSALQGTIDFYAGSWQRRSTAAKNGFTAASLQSAMWGDPQFCQKGETPIDCELRIQNPSVVLVMLGTNDSVRPESYEPNMRKLLDLLVGRGVLPILATKADNLEKDGSINATTARLAYEYDIPVWNLWAALQPLQGHGLQQDGSHLTFSQNFFDDPQAMLAAWPWRNLTALQVLDALRSASKSP